MAPSIPDVFQESPEPTLQPLSRKPVSVNCSHLWTTLCPPRVLSALHLWRAEQGVKCACGAHRELQPAHPSTRIAELGRTEPMRGRGRSMYGGRAVPAAARPVRGAVPGPGRVRRLCPGPLPPRPAPLLRPRAAGAHPRAALLPVRQPGVRRAPAPDLRARLCLLGPGLGTALLPGALRHLRAQSGLQVRAGAGQGGGAAGGGGAGQGRLAHPPAARLPHGAGPVSWPFRPRARRFPAPPTAARGTRPPDACAPTRASWVSAAGIRARAGLSRAAGAWADPLPLPRGPAGTAVTPNYVDNVSARVAPWCHCGVSGNRRDECEAFRGLFTRNHCLGERLGRGGAAPGRAGVRSALTAYRPYHAAWPAGAHFAAAKWALYCRPAPLGICAHLSPETR